VLKGRAGHDDRVVPEPESGRLPIAAAAVTMVLWASAFIAIRAVGAHYHPGAMALGRLAVGSAALSVMLLRWRVRLPRGRPLLLVLGYGALWFGCYAVLINAAERDLDAGTTALVINVAPILIAVLAGSVLREGYPSGLLYGLGVAMAGVVLIAVTTSTGQYSVSGVLFALGAAAMYAVGVLLQKQALASVDPLTCTWLGCLAGAAVCLPFAPVLLHDLVVAPLAATAGIIYLGVFPTAIAFAIWAYALKRSSAGRLSASSYLVPALAVALSWLLLAEVPPPMAIAGGALCLVGVAITRLPARRPVAATECPERPGTLRPRTAPAVRGGGRVDGRREAARSDRGPHSP
jgi:drug/metabolite transporter (DMT)-like permease